MTYAPLDQVCAVAGLDSNSARLLHSRANAVFHLPQAHAVVRLRQTGGSGEWKRRLSLAVEMTRWLHHHGFPTVTPLPVQQPITVGEWTATFWTYIAVDEQSVAPSSSDLGALLRALHELPAPPVDLLATNPLGSLLADLSRSDLTLPVGQHDWLREQGRRLLAEYESAALPLGQGMIHGDAHPGNLLASGGRYLMIDWDSISYGPRAQDLVPTLMGVLRFGRPPANWVALCDAYGVDPGIQDDSGVLLLCRARELRSLAAYLRAADHPGVRAELDKRLSSLMDGINERWRPI
ncbi:aminoglycoside phosphotransferase family protein [Acrocarpospora sp. B8E8]|uniref:phosphotransferase enzyme family protein n=1 Tax=Acrocarpospora sp. B8E8 TaxID=3153572 RepID=UPI00325C6D06